MHNVYMRLISYKGNPPASHVAHTSTFGINISEAMAAVSLPFPFIRKGAWLKLWPGESTVAPCVVASSLTGAIGIDTGEM